MKSWKKLIAMLLAAIMLLIMGACAAKETQTDTPAPAETQTEETTAAPEETPAAEENTETAQTVEGPQYGGHLNLRIASKPSGLDPLKQTGIWKYPFTTCVYENALTRDTDNNICPGVCDFELSDDMLTLKLWVRENMVFHNGDPVEITDVEASMQRAMKLYASFEKFVAPYVAGMEVDGDVLTITFTEYNEKLYYYVAAYQTWCAVMPQEICEKYADDYIVDQIEDAIGTGPYRFTEFKDGESVTVEKWADYVPQESDATGYAGTKHAYLDSISFLYNGDDSSAGIALLSGEYDMVEVLAAEYADAAAAQGIICEKLESNTGTGMSFNAADGGNVCALYPSLRKAVMAAIDYEEFLQVVTDGCQVMGGQPVTDSIYATDVFVNADYYGAANMDVVQKYLDEARAEGWNDEPVVIAVKSSQTTIATLTTAYLDAAGIPYELQSLEDSAYNELIGDTANNWDLFFAWFNYSSSPTLIDSKLLYNRWINEEKDAVIEKMLQLIPGSPEYLELWNTLAEMMVDDCAFAYMSMIEWWWWHPETLHSNDEGLSRYVFNTYWDDPENHTA